MSRQWDALVIGAGPAGLRAASVIAESGLEVVLVDEQAFPGGQIYRHVTAPGAEERFAEAADYRDGTELVRRFRRSGAEYLPETTVWFLEQDRILASRGEEVLDLRARNVIIAVGGGSTIDAAKAIRAVAKETLHIDTDRWECFAVPTTSGTGSEVTDYAVITDRAKGIKYPLDSQALRPPVAILDQELTVSAPASVTADAGMDVLTHALEAYVSKGANDFSDALCEKAVSLVFRFLPLAFQDGTNLLAREKMHNASCMAGLAFNSAGLGLNHGMAHAIGAKLHIAHGRINAMLLPHIITFNADLGRIRNGEYALAAKKYQRMAKVLDLPAPSVRLGVTNLLREVERLNRTLKITASLKEWGAEPSKVKELRGEIVSAALADATTATNPRPAAAEHVEALLNKVMGG